METDLSYWDIRNLVSRMIPRQSVITPVTTAHRLHKGRRQGYCEYKLFPRGWKEYRRELGQMKSALEISVKAAGCPSPLNLDVWDGRVCAYNCLYCFANHFRSTLYANFFDRVPAGLRTVEWKPFEKELHKMLRLRGQRADQLSAEHKAVALSIPVRIGVRFENFLALESRRHVALKVLKVLRSYGYPVIIDTKSTLPAEDEYIEELANNRGGAVVQISLSGVNDSLFKRLEPGAPSPTARFEALKRLNAAGVRAVPRIEPFLPFYTDSPSDTATYIDMAKDAGVEWICWDAFSYSTASAVTRRLFQREGLDFDRMFLAASDSRLLTGVLLWAMMEHFRDAGFKCSTYDDINSVYNDDPLCCNVKGAMPVYDINRTSTKAVEHYVVQQNGRPVSWGEYSRHVQSHGGWLSSALHKELYRLWNNDGNPAYALNWLSMRPTGRDSDGWLWAACRDNPALVRAVRWMEAEYARG
jgi:DNA repair photolyase